MFQLGLESPPRWKRGPDSPLNSVVFLRYIISHTSSIHAWYIYTYILLIFISHMLENYMKIYETSVIWREVCCIQMVHQLRHETIMLLVLGIHAVRRAQLTLNMESTTRRFSDVFLWHFWTMGRFDAGCCCVCVFWGAKIARYFFAGQWQLDTYVPSLYWSDCRGMNNVLQYSQCSGDSMVIEPNGNNAMTSGSQTEPSMVPVDPRVLNLRTLREDSEQNEIFRPGVGRLENSM